MANLSRRNFLQVSASGTALVLGFHLRVEGRTAAAESAPAAETTVNAWLRIAADGAVTVQLSKSEMGQGIYSALPMIVADEMDADWNLVKVEQSPPGAEYRNPGDPTMITGGSSSVSGNWDRLRQVGAAAREMLVLAAAKQWSVRPADCRTENGQVLGPGNKRAGYGELAAEAAKLPPPKGPTLKTLAQWKLIGRPIQTDGTAQFAIDIALPGMLYAAVKTSPVFGGDVENLAQLQKKPPEGVVGVLPIPNGVAVVADSWWKAKEALEGLDVRFKKTPNDAVSSADISKQRSSIVTDFCWRRIATLVRGLIHRPMRSPSHAVARPVTCA
ncbi:MAG: xanthine dehydrogenase family protein molybdopterin-binding subunit [Candidatus Wallbacteria bacterium]|nr:xanthine dehydrogenase family protein molybdopterin-binding subunit [Candidatus Wallbacteria bacterium]